MSRLWPIVRREYVERVRSRPFIIGTVASPLLLVGFMLGPSLILARTEGPALRVAVVGDDGALRAAVERGLGAHADEGAPAFVVLPAGAGTPDEQRARLRAEILDRRLDGYVYLPPDGVERGEAEYHGRNVSNLRLLRAVGRVVDEAALEHRLARAGVDAERRDAFTRRVRLKTLRLVADGEREDRGDTLVLSLILLMALYAGVAMWGAALMNGVIEEKANRVVEVIVSSVPTRTLFAGKLLGVGAAGLTQLGAWAGFTALFGVYGAQAALVGGRRPPEAQPHVLAFFVLFFVLGFFLYGVLYASIGAAVNSQHEAQSLVFLALLPLIVGLMFFLFVAAHPDSPLALALSLVPFWTPLLMFLRIAVSTPPAWQIALSIALTLGAIVALNRGAARIYRVGILMHGKRPTLPEILRWLRS
jgi:ABC-2 type transport system permease protein